jgi:hypothetical protein
VLLAVLASVLVLTTNLVPVGVKLLWCGGVAVIVALRALRPAWATSLPVARVGLAALLLYIGSAYGMARIAEAAMAARYPLATQVQANPAAGVASSHRLVVVEADRYRLVEEDGTVHELPRQQPDAIVRRAMADASIRGFMNWARFPHWTVEEAADHWLVRFIDLRYQGPDVPNPRGIGAVQVVVPKDGSAKLATDAEQ